MQLMNGISNNPISDSFFITEEYATALAKRLPINYMDEVEITNYPEEIRSIENVIPLNFDNSTKPSIYIVNYSNNEGYVVVSADARYEPILSFVKQGNLSLNHEVPSGLEEWFGFHLETISNLQNGIHYDLNAIETAQIRWEFFDLNWGLNDWKNQQNDPTIIQPANPNGDETRYIPCNNIVKGPYLKTNWGLYDGYNDSLSNMNCTTTLNGRPPVGCVAVAVAQLMKYWSIPNSQFNYNLIPLGTNSSNELRRLFKVLGNSN